MPNPLHPTAHVLTVAATGASGALFTRALLQATERDDRINTVNFIASDNALRVFAEELGIKGRNNLIHQLIGKESKKIQAQNAELKAMIELLYGKWETLSKDKES